MAIPDLYSQRNKAPIDVFTYGVLSKKLRIQIVYIWTDFFEKIHEGFRNQFWKSIHKNLCVGHGKKTLLEDGFNIFYHDYYRVEHYFESSYPTSDELIDVVEVVFRTIYNSRDVLKDVNTELDPILIKNAIEDLNARFLQNGLGYEFQLGRIIRIDNTLLHKEVILPTLHFLSAESFANANEEFLKAHEHFRHKRHKECLTECLKALETTMKIICTENNWAFDKNLPAKKLINVCFNNNLIPEYLQSHFSALKTTLETGSLTLRNKLGGHGQGADQIIVPDHYASYMLYLTGTSINFLVACHRDIKSV